jgi:hypothetical protein
MVDRILLNKQEERFFFEYLRIAGGRTPEECAEAVSAPLGRTQDEILQFYWQTVDTIFKGQKGALEGFTHKRMHRILTKFYDTKVLPLYSGAGGSLEAGGSERKVVEAGRKRKEVVDEAALSSGGPPGGMGVIDGADLDRGCVGILEKNAVCGPQAAPKEVSISQRHSVPGQHVSKGIGMGSTYTANTPSQGVGRSGGAERSVPSEVEIMFVPHEEELASRLAAGGIDPCPRMQLKTSETVVSVMKRLKEGWKSVFKGREGGLRLRPPDDCPVVFRGCTWGDPERDGGLTLMDVMEALGATSSTTMGYSWEACALGPDLKTVVGPVKAPKLSITGRSMVKKGKRGKRPSNTTGGKHQKENKRVKREVDRPVPSGRKDGGGQGTEHLPGDGDLERQWGDQAGSSAEKENAANESISKSISFERQAVASFGSPAKDSGPESEGGLPGPRKAESLGISAGQRVPVGIKNLVKQERSTKKRQRSGRKPHQDSGVAVPAQGSEEQLIRKALERMADSLRQQQEIDFHGGTQGIFPFGKSKEVLKPLHGDSVLEALQLEASNLQGHLPPSHPPQSAQPSKTPPSKNQRKKEKRKKSNKNGVIDDPRDLAGLSPPSTFKLPEEFTRIAAGGINGASVRSLTDIFATCHPPSPKTGGGAGGGQAAPIVDRVTPTGGALLNLSKRADLPPGLNLKTCDMSMLSLLDGMSNSNWIMKLGDVHGGAEQEPVEGVGNRPFAKLFGDQQ